MNDELMQADILSPGAELHEEINPQTTVEEAPVNLEASEGEWFLAEGVKGEGEKPDWYNNKTFKNVMEQAKAQNELRKMLGEAPSEYKVELAEEFKDEQIAPDDPLLGAFNEYAKDNKLSQKAYSSIINMWMGYKRDVMSEVAKNREESLKKEREAIGVDADKKLEDLAAWYAQNFGEDSLEEFKNDIQTKAAFDRYSRIRDKMVPSATPKNEPGVSIKHYDELVKLMADPRYSHDRNYQKAVDAEWAKAYPGKTDFQKG